MTVSQRGPQIHPLVASGYAAFLAGDLTKAREDYQQVLREEPANRDALLGIAGFGVVLGLIFRKMGGSTQAPELLATA